MLQDIIQKVTRNAAMQMNRLSYVTTNISNLSTNSYKVKNFETYIDEAGIVNSTVRTDIRKGAMRATKNNLDLAINGPGYFYVTKPDGTTAYTRDGRLNINAKGYLATVDGALVGNGIKVPINYYKLTIAQDGTVSVRAKEVDDPKVIGKINLVNFPNPAGLKEVKGNLLLPTEASGQPEPMEKVDHIKQGTQEMSNTTIWDSVSEALRTNGSYISSLRLVKYTDEMYRNSVNLKQ